MINPAAIMTRGSLYIYFTSRDVSNVDAIYDLILFGNKWTERITEVLQIGTNAFGTKYRITRGFSFVKLSAIIPRVCVYVS